MAELVEEIPVTRSRSYVDRMFATEFAFMGGGAVDPAQLATAFHPDVVIHEPAALPYAGDWRGLDGTAALMRAMNAVWSEMAIKDLVVHGDGNDVLLSCRLKMVVRQGGQVVEQPFAERLRFDHGRLIEGTPFYFDTAEIAAACFSAGS